MFHYKKNLLREYEEHQPQTSSSLSPVSEISQPSSPPSPASSTSSAPPASPNYPPPSPASSTSSAPPASPSYPTTFPTAILQQVTSSSADHIKIERLEINERDTETPLVGGCRIRTPRQRPIPPPNRSWNHNPNSAFSTPQPVQATALWYTAPFPFAQGFSFSPLHSVYSRGYAPHLFNPHLPLHYPPQLPPIPPRHEYEEFRPQLQRITIPNLPDTICEPVREEELQRTSSPGLPGSSLGQNLNPDQSQSDTGSSYASSLPQSPFSPSPSTSRQVQKNFKNMLPILVVNYYQPTVTLNPSQDSSVGSISAWYRGGPGFKSRQGQEFFNENK